MSDAQIMHSCGRCRKPIRLLETHLKVTVTMQNTRISGHRYCAECCADPAMAILFLDVMVQGVKSINVLKIWD